MNNRVNFMNKYEINMENFLDIANNIRPEKEQIIQDFMLKSGLPEETVNQLYESFNFSTGGSVSAIKDGLNSLITSVADSDSFAKIVLKINDIFKFTSKNKNNLIIELLEQSNTNTMAFIKVVCFVLMLKDSANFKKAAETFDIDFSLANLMESSRNFDPEFDPDDTKDSSGILYGYKSNPVYCEDTAAELKF